MIKTCKKCGKKKELSQFYKHSEMKDGCLNICISCKRLYALEYRKKNKVKVIEYDRKRGRLELRRQSYERYIERLKLNDPNKYKSMREKALKKYNEKSKRKKTARAKVYEAIRLGLLIRPELCAVCGKKGKIDAHHKDYNKPLEVIWLCKTCHGKEHWQ